MTAVDGPGSIEIDRSGAEPVVRLVPPKETFTLAELRSFGDYLVTVASETAAAETEPEVRDLAFLIANTDNRFLPMHEASVAIAREILAAGWKREKEAAAPQ